MNWEKNKYDTCFNLPRTEVKSRISLFEKHLKGKTVLHLGCADWPDTEEKMENETLLHYDLMRIAKEVYGIDNSIKGIKAMNGIENVFVGDIYNLHKDKNIIEKRFDALVVSEVIEHLVNPGLALESIEKYILKTNPKCEVIFTVPNYHNFFFSFISGLQGKELVHYDHKFYFSYRTFRGLIENYRYEVKDFSFITYGKGLKGKPLLKRVLDKFSCMSPYLYFKCKIK